MLDFQKIPGQNAVKQHLCKAVSSDRVSHAYMLIGEKGLGKGALAEAFAEMLLCERDSLHPCGECHACRQAEAGTHPDLIYIRHEKPNSIGVNEVRRQLSAEAVIRPFSGKKRIFIVPEAEKMTVQAQNAVLKTMEEPPEYVVILLLTQREEALLETIRSRCVKLFLRPVPEEILTEMLLRRGALTKEAALAVHFARGIPEAAEQMAFSPDFQKQCAEILELLETLPQDGPGAVRAAAGRIRALYPELTDFLEFLRMYYRDVLAIKRGISGQGLIFTGYESRFVRTARDLGLSQAGRLLDEIERTEDRIKGNVNPELALELLLQEIRQSRVKGK